MERAALDTAAELDPTNPYHHEAQTYLRLSSDMAACIASYGDKRQRTITWTHRGTGASEARAISNIFLMIGAEPNIKWLQDCLDPDSKGFVKTGANPDGTALPSPYATTLPGIFAMGDIRSPARSSAWRPGRAKAPS